MEECRGTWTSWRVVATDHAQPSMRHDDDDDDDDDGDGNLSAGNGLSVA